MKRRNTTWAFDREVKTLSIIIIGIVLENEYGEDNLSYLRIVMINKRNIIETLEPKGKGDSETALDSVHAVYILPGL
jgi:hypothetical protein